MNQGAQQRLGGSWGRGVHSFTQQLLTEAKYGLVLRCMVSGAQLPDFGLTLSLVRCVPAGRVTPSFPTENAASQETLGPGRTRAGGQLT